MPPGVTRMKDDQHDDRPDDLDAGVSEVQAEDNDDFLEDESWEIGNDDEWSTTGPAPANRPGAMVAAMVVGAVVALLLVLAWSQLSDDGSSPAARAEGPSTVLSGPPSADTQASGVAAQHTGTTRLARCTSGWRRLQRPLAAAGASLDQWAVHIGAMNKLVVGEITLRQARDFWNATRRGAQRHVEAFQDAVDELTRVGIDCPDPEVLAPGARALPECARSVEAAVKTLRAARTSVATWAEHVHHMEMLRQGQMTPEEATRAWLKSWKKGARELADYQAAQRAEADVDGCGRASDAAE
jgi:hypothetical protein